MTQLQYETPLQNPHEHTLEESEQVASLTFPLHRKWVWIVQIVAELMAASTICAFWVYLARQFLSIRSMFAGSGVAPPAISWWAVAASSQTLGLVFWLGSGILTIFRFRRLGNKPEMLFAQPGTLTVIKRGIVNMRQREIEAHRIREIRVRRLRDLFSKSTVAELSFVISKWRVIRRRIRTKDPQLPARIAVAFRRVLGVKEQAQICETSS